MNPDIIQAFGAALRVANEVVRCLVPAFAAAHRALAGGLVYHDGYLAGYDLRPRDWRAPEPWHRGYLMGRLARCKERRVGPMQ
jgi:hypothetical protein